MRVPTENKLKESYYSTRFVACSLSYLTRFDYRVHFARMANASATHHHGVHAYDTIQLQKIRGYNLTKPTACSIKRAHHQQFICFLSYVSDERQ